MKLKNVSEMTLKEKLGQLILPGFHSTYYDDQIKTLIEDYHVGNVILFTRNFTDALQVRELTKKIHEEIYKATGHIPFIAIDQEGGRVNRMPPEISNLPPANKIASLQDEDLVKKSAELTGELLKKSGFNLSSAHINFKYLLPLFIKGKVVLRL